MVVVFDIVRLVQKRERGNTHDIRMNDLSIFDAWRPVVASMVIFAFFNAGEPIEIPGAFSVYLGVIFLAIFGVFFMFVAKVSDDVERSARNSARLAMMSGTFVMVAAYFWVTDWQAEEWVRPILFSVSATALFVIAAFVGTKSRSSQSTDDDIGRYILNIVWESLFPVALFVGTLLRMLESVELSAIVIIALTGGQYIWIILWRRRMKPATP